MSWDEWTRDGSYRVALPRAIASLFLLADGCVWSGIWSELDASWAEAEDVDHEQGTSEAELDRSWAWSEFASRNASKNNLGFFGIRVSKDQDGALFRRVWARLRSDRRTVGADGFVSSRASRWYVACRLVPQGLRDRSILSCAWFRVYVWRILG